jgi:hypothetical protein
MPFWATEKIWSPSDTWGVLDGNQKIQSPPNIFTLSDGDQKSSIAQQVERGMNFIFFQKDNTYPHPFRSPSNGEGMLDGD